MGSQRYSAREIHCAILWRLARSHGWAHWIPEERIIRAVPSHERGRARDMIERVAREPYLRHDRDRGLRIAHESIGRLAHELRDSCGISEFHIEATLSHFRGFD